MKQWYEALFENYGDKYDAECFARGTVGECDFIEKEIGFNKKLKILDIGCGTGRHSIELAKRGYLVTGIDLSDSLLSKAKEKAARLKLNIAFEKRDARKLTYSDEFDVAIMLCEGAFPLMETDEMNYSILENAEKALKSKGGKFIFTTLNGLFPLFHSVKEFLASQVNDGNATYDENTFDLMTFRDHNVTTVTDDFGVKKQLECNERYYVPCEITWMLKCLGFSTIDIYGAKQGAFSRTDSLQTRDYEMLVVAEK
ncbi:MAG: methyltransferase domain-containing protein [Chitinivibrionales bacterium]|nr:methyltransferase domain-containing protein [Chitinivibrionales bacterium]